MTLHRDTHWAEHWIDQKITNFHIDKTLKMHVLAKNYCVVSERVMHKKNLSPYLPCTNSPYLQLAMKIEQFTIPADSLYHLDLPYNIKSIKR